MQSNDIVSALRAMAAELETRINAAHLPTALSFNCAVSTLAVRMPEGGRLRLEVIWGDRVSPEVHYEVWDSRYKTVGAGVDLAAVVAAALKPRQDAAKEIETALGDVHDDKQAMGVTDPLPMHRPDRPIAADPDDDDSDDDSDSVFHAPLQPAAVVTEEVSLPL